MSVCVTVCVTQLDEAGVKKALSVYGDVTKVDIPSKAGEIPHVFLDLFNTFYHIYCRKLCKVALVDQSLS